MRPLKLIHPLSLLLLFLSLLLGACAPANENAGSESTDIDSRKNPVAITPEEISATTTASLSAIGDVLIHDSVYLDAETENGYDFNPIFEKVKPYLEKSDITVANSESIIGGSEIGVSTYPSFNSPYEVADALKTVGVDVVTMANNHTLDRGEKAIVNAIKYWDKIGIAHTGSALSEKEGTRITTRTANGIIFSFLSYTYGTNGIPTPNGKDYLVNRIDQAKIKKDIERAKEQSDVVVLSLHFGQEYERMPNDEQKQLAQFSAEQGADIILGSHPHVLQPAEWLETSDGRKSFVIYSLGNFISHQEDLFRRIGGILHISVEKTVDADGTAIRLKDPAFSTTYVKNTGLRNFEIDLLANVDPEMNKEIQTHLSTWTNDIKFE
ncbi:CapA family protein [Planomicrobium sp. CPCC 101079]|uniref:CapA family protein n=1 Tax=Planomicrobium sp. CPCC 101079 TaxID=2599618 RepID=UPI0011B3FC34|nr:CapA family protein [Planomicrobium sp. CPCC 101079]TWT01435.1 CapA family protein [Planomicrobium sp. CPCC 101079]